MPMFSACHPDPLVSICRMPLKASSRISPLRWRKKEGGNKNEKVHLFCAVVRGWWWERMVMVGEMVMVWVVVGKERMEERRVGMEGMGKGHVSSVMLENWKWMKVV